MIYHCEDCEFLFLRAGAVSECPSCEGHRFRPATMAEAEQLQNLLKQQEEDNI